MMPSNLQSREKSAHTDPQLRSQSVLSNGFVLLNIIECACVCILLRSGPDSRQSDGQVG